MAMTDSAPPTEGVSTPPIEPPKRWQSQSEWRRIFDHATAGMNPIDRKYLLRQLIDESLKRPPIAASLRRAVYERDGHACLHCGTTETLSLDHVYPYSLGGEDTLENLQTLCRSCNSRKGVRV